MLAVRSTKLAANGKPKSVRNRPKHGARMTMAAPPDGPVVFLLGHQTKHIDFEQFAKNSG